MFYKYFSLTLFLLFLYTMSSGQGWERFYDHSFGGSMGFDVEQTQDGGYVFIGEIDYPTGAIRHYIRMIKTDPNGSVQWEKIYHDGEVMDDRAAGVIPAADDGYFVGGATTNNPLAVSRMLLMKTDGLGDTLWTRQYGLGNAFAKAAAIRQTQDAGFLLAGNAEPFLGQGDVNPYFVKTDNNGNVAWTKHFEGMAFSRIYDAYPTADGGYIASGNSLGLVLLMRLDSSGDSLWTKTFSLTTGQTGFSVRPTPDGGFIMGGSADGFAGPSPFVMKTDAEGNQEWLMMPAGVGLGKATSIELTPDGGYIVAGSVKDYDFFPGLKAGFLMKTDGEGNAEWVRNFGPNEVRQPSLAAAKPTADGGFIAVGAERFVTYLLKTDGLGFSLTNVLQGTVFRDEDESCSLDNLEEGFQAWIIGIQGNDQTVYATTDEEGHYSVSVDTGSYTLSLLPPNVYWDACTNPLEVTLLNFFDTTTLDFPVLAQIDCPLLRVDVGLPFLRRCFDNTYTISYCNEGTIAAENAAVEVRLDPFLELVSATLLFEDLGNNIYRFGLGELASGECGLFQFTAHLDCDATVLGQTHCVEAHIFPDTLCFDTGDSDGPLIRLDAACVNDTVVFNINNVGAGDMQMPSELIVIEDDVMYAPEPYSLGSGQAFNLSFNARGSTFRLEALQIPDLPESQYVSATVEGCGANELGAFSIGFVNQFSLNDDDPFFDIDCHESIGSYDPNDKRAFPEGYREAHYIKPGTGLEYHIRFQNTGTDTAFYVVLRDTLSPYLDPAGIRPGASSHPYEFNLNGEGIITFTFENILLPDSSTNEAASHGFVEFKISQKPGIALGTLIENRAAIVFDFNAPLLTSQTFHTIGENFVEVANAVANPEIPGLEIEVFPNPFSREAVFEIRGLTLKNGLLQLRNSMGQLIRQIPFQGSKVILEAADLPAGLLFFRITGDGRWIGSGKVISTY